MSNQAFLKMSSSRKRAIASCVPCYTRKQKCNREFPCNHCSRRQCTEECVFYANTASPKTSSPTTAVVEADTERPRTRGTSTGTRHLSVHNEWDAYIQSVLPAPSQSSPHSLGEALGYSVGSNSNTLSLIQKLGLSPHGFYKNPRTLPSQVLDEVDRIIQHLPDRQITDFLVQHFVTEVCWMDHLVHAPWFLQKYQKWCTTARMTLSEELDFTILLLRICSYTTQFLPSPGYTIDMIRGVLLSEVRAVCNRKASELEVICTAADSRGSLARVQHLAFFGLQCQTDGKFNAFSDLLDRAIRVAHNLNIHCNTGTHLERTAEDATEREMERRTLCNLYIWDRLLSRQLDRVPFHSEPLSRDVWPQMHLLRNDDHGEGTGIATPSGLDAPDLFTERFLQCRLADFWHNAGPKIGSGFEVLDAEARYEKFCREYLAQLPPVFALAHPDETWDTRCPKLPLQRKLLHTAIYDSICWSFRPLLLPRAPLPAYKSIMCSWQKRKLAVAALSSLDSVTHLHALLGGTHTRAPGIVFSTFEAAVLLVYLYMDPMFPEDCPQQHIPPVGATALTKEPLQAGICSLTLLGCLQAVKGAVKRLKMLAEVSITADICAGTLVQLLSKATEVVAGAERAKTGSEVVANQTKDGESSLITTPAAATTTTGSYLGDMPCASGSPPWNSKELSDLGSASELMSMSGFLGVNEVDIGRWPPFEHQGSSTSAQGMQYWAYQRTNSEQE